MTHQPIIFTHLSVDLDNVLAVLALTRFCPDFANARVEFVDANWNGRMPRNSIALDIEAGGRGIKGNREANGTTHSCFGSVVEQFASRDDQMALAGLVRIVNAHDAYGTAIGHFCPDLDPELLDALEDSSIVGVFRALKGTVGKGEGGDYRMLDALQPIFEGYLGNGRATVEARRIIANGEQVRITKSGLVAYVDNVANHRINDVLFKYHGVRAVIYRNRNNLGVVRRPFETVRMDHPEVLAVITKAGEQHEWFAHPSGFLYCRGSYKAPARSRSTVHPMDLVNAINLILSRS